jgi:hypothetical protein
MPVNGNRRDEMNMDNLVYAPWEHMPFHLRIEEVQRPLSVLEEFFFIRCPARHFKILKEGGILCYVTSSLTVRMTGLGTCYLFMSGI